MPLNGPAPVTGSFFSVAAIRFTLPSCLRRSGSWCRRRTCTAAPAGCPAPACSCRRGRRDRTASRGTGSRSRRASRTRKARAPAASRSTGEQPRCVQMPTTTRYSGLSERIRVLGVRRLLAALALGIGDFAVVEPRSSSASRACGARSTPACRAIRRSSSGRAARSLMSTSTGAPAAFARSEGSMLATKGTAAAAAAPPHATVVAVRRKRRFP